MVKYKQFLPHKVTRNIEITCVHVSINFLKTTLGYP